VTATDRADAIAGALMAAGADAAARELRQRSRELSAAELAWALKRRCDAAWAADPPATAVAADLIERLAEHEPDAVVGALSAWTRGIALLAQGQMEAALVVLERAGGLFAALDRPHDMAQTCISRLMALAMLGRYDDAIRCGAEARAVFDAVGDARAAGKVELNLGNLAARRDHHDDAVGHYGEARARFTAAGDVELEVMALKGLADMLARGHEFEPAEDLYRQARDSAERGGFSVLTALIDSDLGAAELRRGRYDRALQLLERSRAQLARLEVPHHLAVAEERLADAYLELNLLPEALTLYESSLATYEAAGLLADRAWALAQRGRALALLGRHDTAAASLARAEQAFADEDNPTGGALVQLWFAELALKRCDWPAAVRHATAAAAPLLSARRMSGYLHARCLLAEALLGSGDAAEAQRVAIAACTSADALTLAQVQRRVRVLLGLLARGRGDIGEARRCFERAVDSIESQRGTLPGEEFRAAFLGDNLLPFRELVRSSLDEGGPQAAEQALRWVERARARSLADAMGGSHVDDDDTDPARRAQWRLRLRLDDCYRRLSRPNGEGADSTRLLEDVRRIEATLLEASRRNAAGGAQSEGSDGNAGDLDLRELHEVLADHSALVEYFSIDDALLACVVAGGSVDFVRLPVRLDEVQACIEQLRFQTDTLRLGTARIAHRLPELRQRALHHLQRLHAGLWGPLAERLGTRRAVIVPHGALHYLPFEALHDGERHEIERRELCRAPSAAVLLRCLARPQTRFGSALVLGHADARLPHVRAEVEGVAARFPGTRALFGGAARIDALRAVGDIDVLHIACHAQFRNDSPRFSALHLADGALTVRDAARLRLRGGLVTLSACETGISAVMPGDELIGLTHGFISAGAACVLASLWTVQDESTADFMPRFYDRLRASGQPAQALRATQIETLRDQPHPYFWSAFTLHGRW
jgi:tetratricopeptide (TPR) repeat protein